MFSKIIQKILPRPTGRAFGAWQIELTTRCPLRCRMCIRSGLPDWQGRDMQLAAFEKLVPYLKNVENVVLEGWGEPLLYPNLLEAIRLVKQQGARAGFVTSGKGLTAELSKALLRAGVDFMGFSLAGATAKTHNGIRVNSDFEELLEAINRLVRLKAEARLSIPQLHIVFLMLRDNLQETPHLLHIARQIGIHQVVLINLIHITNEWQETQRAFTCEEREEVPVLREVEQTAKTLGMELHQAALSPCAVGVCAENPLRNLYVAVDGEVAPCVYLCPPTAAPFPRVFCGSRRLTDKVIFGNIFQEAFDTLWQNQRYRVFRESFAERNKIFEKNYLPPKSFGYRDANCLRKTAAPALPAPPPPCTTCHKMLGL